MTSAGSGGRREAARTCPCPSRAARGRSDARTAAPRRPAPRARRDHDFCLQAGFPPGHDGRGPPASYRQNVSAGGRGQGASWGTPETRAGAARGRRASVRTCGGDLAGAGARKSGRGVSPTGTRARDRARCAVWARGPAGGDRRARRGVPGWGPGAGCARARSCHLKCGLMQLSWPISRYLLSKLPARLIDHPQGFLFYGGRVEGEKRKKKRGEKL